MINKRIDLYEYFGVTRPENGQGYLNTYVLDPIYAGRKRPAMLVIAGGGYSAVSLREKEPILLRYASAGFNCFTLDYSVKPVTFPAQLIEGAMAMAYIRENAEELMIDPDLVAAIGFSAGGHLTAMLATMFNAKEVKEALKEKADLVKPNAVILSYPVISSGINAHQGSFNNLCGENKSLRKRLSLENKISKKCPPAFIWGTVNDGVVPSENALFTAMKYKEAGVPFELHMFENGSHGLGVATIESKFVNESVQPWVGLSITWLTNRGFVIKDVI
jgi:acetyl esterase/lipase